MADDYMLHPPPPPDEPLPSYAFATSADPLPLLVPYLSPSALYPLTLTSRHYRAVFEPALYSSPHTLFRVGSLSPLSHFILFLRSVTNTPSRSLVHTTSLSLAEVQPSIYTKLPSTWLATLLSRLSNLQLLDLTEFPLVDHATLSAVPAGYKHTTLTILLAGGCLNATASGIQSLLEALPGLRRLELDSAPAGVVSRVGQNITHLCLRDCELTDAALGPLLTRLGTGLKSLDVSRNALTDKTVDVLLDYCVAAPAYDSVVIANNAAGISRLRMAATKISAIGAGKLLRAVRIVALDFGELYRKDEEKLVGELSVYGHSILRELRIGWRVIRTLKRDILNGLEKAAFVGVPGWADKEDVRKLIAFVTDECASDRLRLVELEIGQDGEDEFSFFGDAEEGGEGGKEKAQVLEEVRNARAGRKWRTRVKIVRDLGGQESRERGSGADRWGVVREGI